MIDFLHAKGFAAGLEPAPSSPGEMRRVIEEDLRKWGQLIQATGLRAE